MVSKPLAAVCGVIVAMGLSPRTQAQDVRQEILRLENARIAAIQKATRRRTPTSSRMTSS